MAVARPAAAARLLLVKKKKRGPAGAGMTLGALALFTPLVSGALGFGQPVWMAWGIRPIRPARPGRSAGFRPRWRART